MKQFQYYYGYKEGRATIFAKEIGKEGLHALDIEDLKPEEAKAARLKFAHDIGDTEEER